MIFLRAQWRDVLIFNYEVEPSILNRWKPKNVELDTWNGRHYVSLVGFRFIDTRVLKIKLPFHHSFCEVNLRFYVRREVRGELRRGVVFVREFVPLPLVTAVARLCFKEPYKTAPIRFSQTKDSKEYSWRHSGGSVFMKIHFSGEPKEIPLGSEAEFITEHYWGYNGSPSRQTREYEVKHPRWRVWDVFDPELKGDFSKIYGPEWNEFFQRGPKSVILAEGSQVTVGNAKTVGL